MLSLSTCWNSHRHTDGRSIAAEAREMGFQRVEISHGTSVALLPGLLQAVEAGEIAVSSLHNFCPSPVEVMMDAPDVYELTSARAWERERAISLTKKTIEMAARFRVDRIVLHMGTTRMRALTRRLEELVLRGAIYSRKYTEVKLDLVRQRAKAGPPAMALARDALHQLLPVAEQHRVALAIETRSHFEQVPDEIEMLALLDEFADTPWLGAWHDFGHVQRKANLGLLDHEAHLRAIAPRLLGCHVHDVTWPAKDHRVPFTGGGVDFDKLLPLVPATVPLVWELSPSQRKRDIIEQKTAWEGRIAARLNHPSPLPRGGA